MRAGQLRQRGTIQKNTPSRNSYGELIDSWSDVATVWCSVEPISGSERWVQSAAQRYADCTARIRMRYRSDVTVAPTMRFVHGSDVYNIEAVIEPYTRHQELQLMCRLTNAG